MISFITSLYKSDQHLKSFIKRVKIMSKKLKKHGMPHEFIFLPNDPNEMERYILKKPIDNVKIIQRNLETLYATWNVGINNATYENICFWNVDDIRFEKAIMAGLDDIKNGAEIVYFPFIYLRFIKIWKIRLLAKIKFFFPPIFNKEIFLKEMPCGPFFMTSKKSFKKIGNFNEKYTVAGDFEWCARAANYNLSFKRNDNIAGIFTSDGTTLSGSRSLNHKTEGEEIIKMYQ